MIAPYSVSAESNLEHGRERESGHQPPKRTRVVGKGAQDARSPATIWLHVNGGRANVDHKATGDDRGRNLDQAIRNDPRQSDAPRRKRRGITEEKARQKREREPAEAGGEDGKQRREHEREQVVAEDAQCLLALGRAA